MKALSQHINEAFKEEALGYKHEVLPADWKKFVTNSQTVGLSHSIDDDDELIHDGKYIVARWDSETLFCYTDLSKQDFYDVALRKKYKSIQK